MTITIAGRRYRYVGRRRKKEQEATVAAATPHCPYCGGDRLHGAGEAIVGPRLTRMPMVCHDCGADVMVHWRTSPAMRDWYYASHAGVSVPTFRRYRDAALKIYRGDKPRGA